MTATTAFDVGAHIRDIAPDVFETMVSARAELTENHAPLALERISGAIGIVGDSVTGAVYLHLPELFAQQAAGVMLAVAAGQLATDSETNDVTGELTNIIAGVLKSVLCDAGYFCAVSTPSVIRGAFSVEASPGMDVDHFYFLCLGQRIAVEVHLNFF